MPMELISIVIPVYNEEDTVQEVVENIRELPFNKEVILVDDGSTDGTVKILSEMEAGSVKILRHKTNRGKTAALKTAFKAVQGDIVVIQDADLEYDSREIGHLIEPILQKRGDVVYGSRFRVREASRVLYYYHYLANKCLTFLSNLLTNKNMTDIETCYKAFRSELITEMPITSSGFGIEVEITAKISKTEARIYEVPISYYGRTYEEGKKIHFKDGLAAFWYVFRYNFFSSRETKNYITKANMFLSSDE